MGLKATGVGPGGLMNVAAPQQGQSSVRRH